VRRRRVRHPRPVHRALVRPRAILHRRPTVCCPGWCLPGWCRRQRDAPGPKGASVSVEPTSTAHGTAYSQGQNKAPGTESGSRGNRSS
jgi:hypothetical protein